MSLFKEPVLPILPRPGRAWRFPRLLLADSPSFDDSHSALTFLLPVLSVATQLKLCGSFSSSFLAARSRSGASSLSVFPHSKMCLLHTIFPLLILQRTKVIFFFCEMWNKFPFLLLFLATTRRRYLFPEHHFSLTLWYLSRPLLPFPHLSLAVNKRSLNIWREQRFLPPSIFHFIFASKSQTLLAGTCGEREGEIMARNKYLWRGVLMASENGGWRTRTDDAIHPPTQHKRDDRLRFVPARTTGQSDLQTGNSSGRQQHVERSGTEQEISPK